MTEAEDPLGDAPIQVLEQIALALGLDERLLSVDLTAGADESLGIRLRTLQTQGVDGPKLSQAAVAAFADAASVMSTQHRLQEWLSAASPELPDPSGDYGGGQTAAWRVGYRLAEHARDFFALGSDPIPSVREFVEERLRIPVVQAELGSNICGATVSTGDVRGIILNTVGQNENVWVRRATLAHELAHLLFDPEPELKSLRVDTYKATSANPESELEGPNYVEQRANAFAIAFLAPPEAVRDMAGLPPADDAVAATARTFGISRTAAGYHVSNSYWGEAGDLGTAEFIEPTPEQTAAENFTIDFFRPESTPLTRRGQFAGLVAGAHARSMLSTESAALYLRCSPQEFLDDQATLADLFPSFQPS